MPEVGIYALVNVRCPQYVLDTNGGIVVAYPYVASISQQWDLTTSDGICWYFQNVESGRYLGLPIDDHVKNRVTLREVDHKFAWRLRQHGGHQDQFMLYVPYTEHVIDLNLEGTKPGTVLYIHKDGAGTHQAWHLSKDLHLATSVVLKNGGIYKIINSHSKTAVTLKDDHTVACFRSDHREGQKFQAIETENGWAFRNVQSKRYLGIPQTVVYPTDGPRLSSVTKEFSWMVLPHHEHRGRFKIWIPFTQKVIDLHRGKSEDDTPMHILGSPSVAWIWWEFECIFPPWDSEGAVAPDCVTGERDPA